MKLHSHTVRACTHAHCLTCDHKCREFTVPPWSWSPSFKHHLNRIIACISTNHIRTCRTDNAGPNQILQGTPQLPWSSCNQSGHLIQRCMQAGCAPGGIPSWFDSQSSREGEQPQAASCQWPTGPSTTTHSARLTSIPGSCSGAWLSGRSA